MSLTPVVSFRLKLIFALCAAVAAGLIVGWLQGARVGLIVFCAVASGVALGRFSLRTNKEEVEPNSPAPSPAVMVERRNENHAPTSALLEATMNDLREGVLVIDEAMNVVASNSAAQEIFAGLKGKLEQKRLSQLTRNPAVHAAFRAAIEHKQRSEAKVELLDSERRVFDLRVAPLQTGLDEGMRGALGVFFDITQLERLERVRQEFLSNVSHELRTPLTAIIAFVETLEEGAINDAEHAQRFLAIIRRNAARMHHLIDDILELSAIEAGTVTVETTRVHLRPLVADIVSALNASAGARRITLYNQVADTVFVYADARRLEQMLTNLCDNAIKFNREGGSVTIEHEEVSGKRDRISVTDAGEGIAPEHIERIFERFYRIDRARSREMGGTGLGLAIVKHLARAHGGEASVTSNAGQGSTFSIELPAMPQKESQATPLLDALADKQNEESVTEQAESTSLNS